MLQSRPYLCNMAVAEAHRRRGYGLALLTAAEALVRSLGENEIYLHTRWVDPELGSCRAVLLCVIVVHSIVWCGIAECFK